MNKPQNQISWLREIDFLRGMGILAVIGIHVAGNYQKMTQMNWLFYGNLGILTYLRFAVPLFLLISGLVLTQKYYDGLHAGQFYTKRLKAILLPYFIFSIIYIAAFGALKGLPNIGQATYQIISGTASEHLWFIRLIVELYLIYPMIIWMYREAEKRALELYFLAAILLIQILMNCVMSGSPDGEYKTLSEVISLIATFLRFWFYFVLGIYLSRNLAKLKMWRDRLLDKAQFFIILMAAALTYLNTQLAIKAPHALLVYIAEPVLFVCGFVIAYLVIQKLTGAKFIANFVLEMGKYSYGIYLIHILFLWVSVRIMEVVHVNRSDLIFYPSTFVMTILMSYFASLVLNLTPASQAFLGIPKKK